MRHTSIKINPLPEKELLKKEVGQLSVDIYHKEKEIVILAPIAGVEEKDVKISVTDDVLVIKGTRIAGEGVNDEDYYTRECFWGSFSRSIVLPEEADSKNISANFDNCVLEIRIPKTELEHTKIIKIKSPKK
jgi:HSP20 family protein